MTEQPPQGRPAGPAGPPGGPGGRRPQDSARLANLPYVLVFGGMFGGLLWVWLSKTHVKGGVIVMAVSLLAAAVVRLVCQDERAGLLVSRRRALDVAAFTVLGAGLLAAALVIPSPS